MRLMLSLALMVAVFFPNFLWASSNRVLDGQTITNGANTLTLPTATDTLVGKTTTDTLTNKTIDGSSNTLTNVPMSAANGILPLVNGGTGASTQSGAANAVLPTQSSNSGKFLTTDGSSASWATVNSVPTITGSQGTPSAITAGGGIAFTGTSYENIWFVQGSGGAVTVTANPQIAAATSVGQRLTIITESATNTVKLQDGTGLALNGAWIGGLNGVLTLIYDGSVWVERSRR